MRNLRRNRTVLGVIGAIALMSATAYATVFTDDVIGQMSMCVGVDCTTSESFNYDTLRLKENNLQIHFDDTSASGSFPSNDWRIVANDTANGGSNYLAFQDATASTTPFRVEAGAGNNALYVDAQGDVGIGTADAVLEAHIADGDSPGLRLEQNASNGWTPQTWDVAGNETNFFVRDVTNSSSLPFKIMPGASDNALVVTGSGDIGMGSQSPSGALHVKSSRDDWTPHLILENSSASNGFSGMRLLSKDASIDFNNAGGLFRINYDDGDGYELELDADGNLKITGNLVANGQTFPDYVFEDSYQLMSLPDVERYIQANGHLPNVPSATEIEKNGMNMTQVQKILMEKVEELTLHTIDQHHAATEKQRIIAAQQEQLSEQKQVLDSQGARIDALEKKLEMLIAAQK
jgi:hypothetical protein